MSDATYFIGVDGGGTKCRARLRGAGGELLGEGLGGPANIRLGLDPVWEHILDAIDGALAQARLSRAIFPQANLGLALAGIMTATDAAKVTAKRPDFAHIVAANDAHVACLGAFSGRDGAIMIAGTGSAGYAWVKGRPHTVGGWGFEVSDDGSAAVLGREAIRVALHGHDGLSPHTAFTRAVIAHFGGHPPDIVAWIDQAGPGDYGGLAPLVLSFAGQGDPVAVELTARAAHDIGRYLKRLHDLGAPKICLVGGMAEPLTPWLNPWARTLLQAPEHDAVEGALLLAQGAPDGLTPRPAAEALS